jgi:hypothetical protein
VLTVGFGVAFGALACRSIVGIDALSLATAGNGGTAGEGVAGSTANGGVSGTMASEGGDAGKAGTSASSAGSSEQSGGGRAGTAGATAGNGGAPVGGGGGGGGASGSGPVGGGGNGGAPPECGGARGPCIMCCHGDHMSAGQFLDMYLRMCICNGSSCESSCSGYCAPGPPDTTCSSCTNDVVKDPACNALTQCDGDPDCSPLSKCIEECP